MSKSTEDVLLVVSQVKVKKCDGSLYIMKERMGWMQSAKNSFSENSFNYGDIKVQKISPDTKDKVQLQVQLHCGKACTFHFANSGGREAQKQDRDNVKELLQQLLPKFRVKKDVELEEKNRLLTQDRDLFEMYKVLVVGEVMSADDFWASRQEKFKATSTTDTQEVGVSAAFLADIQPISDGCNGMRYNLTADIIESIFRTYPSVRERHAECVPHQVTENAFWLQFFQSHYFHRDRISMSSKDIFTECAQRDDLKIQAELKKPVGDPLIDLSAMSDFSLGEEYGSGKDDQRLFSNSVNSSLIKRFNQHSTMVLKSCDRKSSAISSTAPPSTSAAASTSLSKRPYPDGTQLNGSLPHTSTNHEPCNNGSATNGMESCGLGVSAKKARLREKIELDDLDGHSEVEIRPAGPSLQLSKVDSYYHGPTPEVAMQYNTSEDLIDARNAHTQDLLAWSSQPPTQLLMPQSAYKVLQELSGSLMHRSTKQQLYGLVPEDLQKEIKHLYSALAELLRHFWACFPVTSKELEVKVVRMKDCLQRFEQTKLDPLTSKMASATSYQSVDVVYHMKQMLDTAFKKFVTWQNRKLQRRTLQ